MTENEEDQLLVDDLSIEYINICHNIVDVFDNCMDSKCQIQLVQNCSWLASILDSVDSTPKRIDLIKVLVVRTIINARLKCRQSDLTKDIKIVCDEIDFLMKSSMPSSNVVYEALNRLKLFLKRVNYNGN